MEALRMKLIAERMTGKIDINSKSIPSHLFQKEVMEMAEILVGVTYIFMGVALIIITVLC